MRIWPEKLPSGFLAQGFSIQPQSNVIRTTIDSGPITARQRYAARTIIFKGNHIYNAQELAIFEDFFHTVLADGVLRFCFQDPITQKTAEFRFTKEYSIKETKGLFEVSIELERL